MFASVAAKSRPRLRSGGWRNPSESRHCQRGLPLSKRRALRTPRRLPTTTRLSSGSGSGSPDTGPTASACHWTSPEAASTAAAPRSPSATSSVPPCPSPGAGTSAVAKGPGRTASTSRFPSPIRVPWTLPPETKYSTPAASAAGAPADLPRVTASSLHRRQPVGYQAGGEPLLLGPVGEVPKTHPPFPVQEEQPPLVLGDKHRAGLAETPAGPPGVAGVGEDSPGCGADDDPLAVGGDDHLHDGEAGHWRRGMDLLSREDADRCGHHLGRAALFVFSFLFLLAGARCLGVLSLSRSLSGLGIVLPGLSRRCLSGRLCFSGRLRFAGRLALNRRRLVLFLAWRCLFPLLRRRRRPFRGLARRHPGAKDQPRRQQERRAAFPGGTASASRRRPTKRLLFPLPAQGRDFSRPRPPGGFRLPGQPRPSVL